MGISYDVFIEAFLSKITEFEFLKLPEEDRESITIGYLKRAVSEFKKNCLYDLAGTINDTEKRFDVEIADKDLDEIVNIISEGMVVQWMKPYLYKQEILENTLNTKDFTTYSPAQLLLRVREAYKQLETEYKQMIREYSYNHGALTELHI